MLILWIFFAILALFFCSSIFLAKQEDEILEEYFKNNSKL